VKALVIREPWIDLILDGKKTWELRTKPTSIRGRIALIRQGSGEIAGVANLVDVLPSLRPEDLADSIPFHGVPASRHQEVAANNWLTPWVLVDAKRLAAPVSYTHPSGAVTWVDLEASTSSAVERGLSIASRPRMMPKPSPFPPPGATGRTSSSLTIVSDAAKLQRANSPKISPALETQLVMIGEERSFSVKALVSSQTKMREFSTQKNGTQRFVFVDRMPASDPQFRVFIEPWVDEIIERQVARIPGVSRFRSRTRGDHLFRHSAFRAFAPLEPEGEPAAHGWLVESSHADRAFAAFLTCVRSA
jgi:hypothetical protein